MGKGRDILGFTGLGGVGAANIPAATGGFRGIGDAILGGIGVSAGSPVAPPTGGFSIASIASGMVGIWGATAVVPAPVADRVSGGGGGGGHFVIPDFCDYEGNMSLAVCAPKIGTKKARGLKLIRSIVREFVEVPVEKKVYVDREVIKEVQQPYPVYLQSQWSFSPLHYAMFFAGGFAVGWGIASLRNEK